MWILQFNANPNEDPAARYWYENRWQLAGIFDSVDKAKVAVEQINDVEWEEYHPNNYLAYNKSKQVWTITKRKLNEMYTPSYLGSYKEDSDEMS